MTRATKRGLSGRIWPSSRQFDTPVPNSVFGLNEITLVHCTVVLWSSSAGLVVFVFRVFGNCAWRHFEIYASFRDNWS